MRDDPNLSIEEKIGILESWAYDDAEISVAVEEGMPGPGAPAGHAQRILQILEALSAGVALDRTGPSKQHGIPSGSLKAR